MFGNPGLSRDGPKSLLFLEMTLTILQEALIIVHESRNAGWSSHSLNWDLFRERLRLIHLNCRVPKTGEHVVDSENHGAKWFSLESGVLPEESKLGRSSVLFTRTRSTTRLQDKRGLLL